MTTHLKNTLVAASPWEQATLLINGKKVEWRAEFVLLRGQENAVTVSAPPEIAGAINLGLVEGGGLNIIARPNFGDWVAPVNGRFNWSIIPDAGKSGRITLVFLSREVVEAWEHRSLVISRKLADEVDVKIDGFEVPAQGSIWFYRDKARTVTLTPKSGSPWPGLPITLTCTVYDGLDVDNVVSAPAFGSEQTTYSWGVTGNTKSGRFWLTLADKGMTTPIDLVTSKLISSNLADEADLLIDGKAVPPTGIDFYHREPRIVSLRPKYNSPIARFPVALKRSIISGLKPEDLRSEPPFDGFQTDHRWTVTGVSGVGTFRLSLAGESMTHELDAPNCRVRSEQSSLRFYYANASQYAPLPPEVVNQPVGSWNRVDLKLMHADGSSIAGAPVTIYRPEKEPVSGRTDVNGVMLGFPDYQYTTPGARTFEAVATLPSGEVRVTYLINVQP